MAQLTFHWADYLVCGIFLLLSATIGIVIGFINRKGGSSQDYLLAGQGMHWIPVALSMQASFQSAILIMSTPNEIYTFGITYSYMAISFIISGPILAHLYLPIYHRLKIVSAYTYLEMRFNRTVRLAGSLTFCFMILLYMSVVLYTPAISLSQVTGLSIYISISVFGVVCVIYTFLGGMKATIWNDFLQMIIIFGCIIVIVVMGALEQDGGFSGVWKISENGSRINFNSFDPDPTLRTTFWTQVVGTTFINTTLNASSQTVIQKLLSVKKLRDAQKSVYFSTFTSTVLHILIYLTGLVMYAYYANCDPYLNGEIEKADQRVAYFVMELLGHLPGLPGLFMASSFSAALSSISGSVNALSAVLLYDFVKPAYTKAKGKVMDDKTILFLSKLFVLIFGAFVIGMGFLAQFMGSLMLQIALSIFGFVGGPLLTIITLGMFFPFVNSWGALCGLLSSLGICAWIAIGTMVEKIPAKILDISTAGCSSNVTSLAVDACCGADSPLAAFSSFEVPFASSEAPEKDYLWIYRVSYMWYALIACIISFTVAIPVSLITGRTKQLNPKLVYNFGSSCCCCCPGSCQSCMRCGVEFSESADFIDNNHHSSQTDDDVIAYKVTVESPTDFAYINPAASINGLDYPGGDDVKDKVPDYQF